MIAGVALLLVAGIIVYIFLCVIYIVKLSALLQYIGYRIYHRHDSRSGPAVSGGHHRLHLPLCHIYIVTLSALLQYIGYCLYHCHDSRSGPAVSGGHHRLHPPLCHLSYIL